MQKTKNTATERRWRESQRTRGKEEMEGEGEGEGNGRGARVTGTDTITTDKDGLTDKFTRTEGTHSRWPPRCDHPKRRDRVS